MTDAGKTLMLALWRGIRSVPVPLVMFYLGIAGVGTTGWLYVRQAESGALPGVAAYLWWASVIFILLWIVRLMLWLGYRDWPAVEEAELPVLTILVPCYNEGKHIGARFGAAAAATIRSIASS